MRIGSLATNTIMTAGATSAVAVILAQKEQTNQNIVKVACIVFGIITKMAYDGLCSQLKRALLAKRDALIKKTKEVADGDANMELQYKELEKLSKEVDKVSIDLMHSKDKLYARFSFVVLVGVVTALTVSSTAWAKGETSQRLLDVSAFVRKTLFTYCSQFNWITPTDTEKEAWNVSASTVAEAVEIVPPNVAETSANIVAPPVESVETTKLAEPVTALDTTTATSQGESKQVGDTVKGMLEAAIKSNKKATSGA